MKLFTRLSFLFFGLIFSYSISAQLSGSLDPNFGNNGRVQFDVGGSETETLTGALIQEDAKIIVTGMTGFGSGSIIAARYFPNGSIDPSFGNNGMITTNPGSGLFYAWDLAFSSLLFWKR